MKKLVLTVLVLVISQFYTIHIKASSNENLIDYTENILQSLENFKQETKLNKQREKLNQQEKDEEAVLNELQTFKNQTTKTNVSPREQQILKQLETAQQSRNNISKIEEEAKDILDLFKNNKKISSNPTIPNNTGSSTDRQTNLKKLGQQTVNLEKNGENYLKNSIEQRISTLETGKISASIFGSLTGKNSVSDFLSEYNDIIETITQSKLGNDEKITLLKSLKNVGNQKMSSIKASDSSLRTFSNYNEQLDNFIRLNRPQEPSTSNSTSPNRPESNVVNQILNKIDSLTRSLDSKTFTSTTLTINSDIESLATKSSSNIRTSNKLSEIQNNLRKQLISKINDKLNFLNEGRGFFRNKAQRQTIINELELIKNKVTGNITPSQNKNNSNQLDMFESPSSQTELLQSERQLPGSRTNTETTTRSSSSSQNQEKPKTINDHINDYIINPIKNIITQLKNLMNYFKGTAKYTPIKKEEITFENLEQTIKDNLASAKKLPASEKINVANDYYDLALKIKNDQSLTEQQKETSKKIISKAIGQLRKSINNTKLLREIQLTANKISMIKMSDDKPSSSNSSPGDKYDNSDPDNYLLREHEQTDGGRHGSSTNSGDYDDPDYESFA